MGLLTKDGTEVEDRMPDESESNDRKQQKRPHLARYNLYTI